MTSTTRRLPAACLATVLLCSLAASQSTTSTQASPVVPRLVNFSGKAADAQGKPISGIAGATFSIYKDQYEGSPLWMESQNVQADSRGNYTVQLGATKPGGLPLDLFTSGEARWLGVTINGGSEQLRVLLLSVPYALKAADAETVGGLPASAFVLAAPPASNGTSLADSAAASFTSSASSAPPLTSLNVTTTGGNVNSLPLFTTSTNIQNSIVTQSGTTSISVAGKVNLPATGTATSTGGKNSQPEDYVASAYNSTAKKAVAQTFQLQAEPLGNNTSTASGTLNLLFGSGTSTPTETGFKIASNGQVTFASGQTFPGTGSGTVTSVGSGTGLTGGPITSAGTLSIANGGVTNTMLQNPSLTVTAGTGLTGGGVVALGGATTLNLDATKVPQLTAANTFTNLNAVGVTSSSTALSVSNSGSGSAISGTSTNSSTAAGVYGSSPIGYGVIGNGGLDGVYGSTSASGGNGVYGTSSNGNGVYGNSSSGLGVYGTSSSSTGVYGFSSSGYGMFGQSNSTTGIYGYGFNGVEGVSDNSESGVYGTSGGWGVNAYGVGSGTGILASSDTGYAGWFNGSVEVNGNLTKGGGSFKIDHPLDPTNKYLYHSFVESPDMMNIYNGNVTTDAEGNAVVDLPNWFEALNRDFRYQLTVIGQFAEAIVSSEISNHQFAIKTDKPNVKVSWQVTGIRQDVWANAHRIPVEIEKPEQERGSYLHPELFGEPSDKGIAWARYPKAVKHWKESRAKLEGATAAHKSEAVTPHQLGPQLPPSVPAEPKPPATVPRASNGTGASDPQKIAVD